MTALEKVRDLLADRPEFRELAPFDLRELAAELVYAASDDGCESCSGCECCNHECEEPFDEHCECCVNELPADDAEVAVIIKRYDL